MAAAAIPFLGAIGAQGQEAQGVATYDALNSQADVQDQNASEALAQGQFNAMRQHMIAEKKIGTSEAAYSAAGVSGNSGSVLEVLRNSATNAELDRLNILHGADVKSINYENQAALNRYGAKSALVGSKWAALGSVTGGLIKGYSAASAGATNASDTSYSGEGAGLE